MIFSALAAVAFAAPARAETITLICTPYDPDPWVIVVNLSNRTVCGQAGNNQGCFLSEHPPNPSPATITDQLIIFDGGSVTINRMTGLITYVNHATGMCKAAKQKF